MLPKVYASAVLVIATALLTISAPALAESFVDDFPAALSNYRTGGWQWPYSDGSGAGTVSAGPDNWTVYMDGTYNAVAYAFRRSPEMYVFNVTIDFVVPTRDDTPGDQIFIALRYKNPTYPTQSECPSCALPTADSGVLVDFFLGENRVFVTEIGKNESATSNFILAIGRPHEARVELLADRVTAYLDGSVVIEATNLTSPPGLFGIIAYREDIILDKVWIDVTQTSAPPPSSPPPPPSTSNGPSGISWSSPWIIGPVGWFTGVVSVLFALKVRPRIRKGQRQP